MTRDKLARFIDHTLLKADATADSIIKVCKEAVRYGFYSVCVNPNFVPLAASELNNSNVKVCTVVGFPLGATTKDVKVFEASEAVRAGAGEIDMVINIGRLKDAEYTYVEEEISQVVEETAKLNPETVVKVIIETCYLTEEEKIKACELSKKAGAHFVKTSTGFGTGGATVEDIKLMCRTVGSKLGVKASGGIRSYQDAILMIEAGATRIGASAGVKIISEAK